MVMGSKETEIIRFLGFRSLIWSTHPPETEGVFKGKNCFFGSIFAKLFQRVDGRVIDFF